jgi:hypothetical protein
VVRWIAATRTIAKPDLADRDEIKSLRQQLSHAK